MKTFVEDTQTCKTCFCYEIKLCSSFFLFLLRRTWYFTIYRSQGLRVYRFFYVSCLYKEICNEFSQHNHLATTFHSLCNNMWQFSVVHQGTFEIQFTRMYNGLKNEALDWCCFQFRMEILACGMNYGKNYICERKKYLSKKDVFEDLYSIWQVAMLPKPR